MKAIEGSVFVCESKDCTVELTVTKSCQSSSCGTECEITATCCDEPMKQKSA